MACQGYLALLDLVASDATDFPIVSDRARAVASHVIHTSAKATACGGARASSCPRGDERPVIWQMMVLYDILAAASLLMLLQKCFLASASSFGRRSYKARHLRLWKACMLASAIACILSLPHGCSAISSPPPPYALAVNETCQTTSRCGSIPQTAYYCTNSTAPALEPYRYVYDYAPWSLQV